MREKEGGSEEVCCEFGQFNSGLVSFKSRQCVHHTHIERQSDRTTTGRNDRENYCEMKANRRED